MIGRDCAISIDTLEKQIPELLSMRNTVQISAPREKSFLSILRLQLIVNSSRFDLGIHFLCDFGGGGGGGGGGGAGLDAVGAGPL